MTGKIFFLFLISYLSIPANPVLFAEEYPIAGSRTNICILAYETKFKKSLTASLVQDLNSKGIGVTVDSLSNGCKYKAGDYDAVILLSGALIFNPKPEAVKYIKTNNYSSNIIYVFTTRNSTSPYGIVLDKNKIDAITSASNKPVEDVKNEIIGKIQKHMGKN